MKVLFIGGTGFISAAVSREAVTRGIDLYLLNRGSRGHGIDGAHHLKADVNVREDVLGAVRDLHFDAVVDWIAFTPDDIERDLALFHGRTDQFVFVSSASAYQKPPSDYLITESTPLYNPFWEYARQKIACEMLLMDEYRKSGFPVTIVRPSLTYDPQLPLAIGGWGCYTLIDRLKKGRPIIVHGDGSSLWVVTHAVDFAQGFLGLVGNDRVAGQAYHITSDEVQTWDQIYRTIADALGVEANIVHISSDFICDIEPDLRGTLIGDKSWSAVFDNSKIKRLVPGFQARIPFRQGVRWTIAGFESDERRQRVDDAVNASMDRILEAYRQGRPPLRTA